MEEANDRSKCMCFMLSGDRIAFDSRRCDIIFPMKSVQTTYSSKGDVSYLYEGKTKELSRERERERERERRERERVCKTCKVLAGPFQVYPAMRFGYS